MELLKFSFSRYYLVSSVKSGLVWSGLSLVKLKLHFNLHRQLELSDRNERLIIVIIIIMIATAKVEVIKIIVTITNPTLARCWLADNYRCACSVAIWRLLGWFSLGGTEFALRVTVGRIRNEREQNYIILSSTSESR